MFFLGRTLDEKPLHSTKSSVIHGGRSRAESPRVSLWVALGIESSVRGGDVRQIRTYPMCYNDSIWIKVDILRGTKNSDLCNKRVFWWGTLKSKYVLCAALQRKQKNELFNVFLNTMWESVRGGTCKMSNSELCGDPIFLMDLPGEQQFIKKANLN